VVLGPAQEGHDVLGNDRDRPVVADSHVLETSAFRDGQRPGRRAQVVAAAAGDIAG